MDDETIDIVVSVITKQMEEGAKASRKEVENERVKTDAVDGK